MNATDMDSTAQNSPPAKRARKAGTITMKAYEAHSTIGTYGTRLPGAMVRLLLGSLSDDRMDVYRAVKHGFTLSSVLEMIETSAVYKRAGVLAKIVGTSERTLARRMQEPDKALSAEQSSRALYYAELMEKATEVLGTRALAEEWMAKPARGLDGETPIDLIANAVGYELVNDLLTRMDYGVY